MSCGSVRCSDSVSCCWLKLCLVFFFKQKTAYEMRISDWSSDVCSSDLGEPLCGRLHPDKQALLYGPRVDGVQSTALLPLDDVGQIGRASCRERVCQYV